MAVTDLTVAPASVSVSIGAKTQLAATVLPEDATVKRVIWSSSDHHVAKVSGSGKVTGRSAGTATITARTMDGKHSASSTVTVVDETQLVPVTGLTITPATVTLKVGVEGNLKATIQPANASDQSLIWTSSNEDVVTVDSFGAIWGFQAGTAIITATTPDGRYTASSTVTVLPEPAKEYALSVAIAGNGAGSTSILKGAWLMPAGEAKAITATPVNGSVFAGWSGAFNGDTNPLTVTMDGDKSLTATFTSSDTGGDDGKRSYGPAFGFAQAVTGGAGGETVRVTTADQLRQELCRSTAGDSCTDTAPRIIEIAATIDFTDSEGSAQAKGCFVNQICTAPAKSVTTVLTDPASTACDGKTQFDVTYQKAALRGLLVGSNKTVLGIGQSGGLKGKGLLLTGGVSNIIVRNLSFTDIAQGLARTGDAITVSEASRVWIDHNYFARIGGLMVGTGTADHTGQVTDTTISWNDFDGRDDYSPACDGKRDGPLFPDLRRGIASLGGKGNVTFAYNWAHHFYGIAAATKAGGSLVHALNNFFSDGSRGSNPNYWATGLAALGITWATGPSTNNGVYALVEGNYFDESVSGSVWTINSPVGSAEASHILAPYGALVSFDGGCQAAIGRDCFTNGTTPRTSTPVSGEISGRRDYSVASTFGAIPVASIVVPVSADLVKTSVQAGAGVGKD